MLDSVVPRGEFFVSKYDDADIRAYARRGRLGPFSALGRVRHTAAQRRRGANGVWVPAAVLEAAGVVPYEVSERFANLWTTTGLTRLWNLYSAQGSTQAFDATHTRLGVGDGSTAAANGDTDLSAAAGSTHRWFNLVDSAGTVSSRQISYVSTFATGDGNFQWAEFASCQGTSNGNTVTAPMFNRSVPGTSLGTKTSGSWALTLVLSA